MRMSSSTATDVFRSCGSVMYRNACHFVVPSSSPASYSDGEIACSPARNRIMYSPTCSHSRSVTTATQYTGGLVSDSHGTGSAPNSPPRTFATPEGSPLNSAIFHTSAATTYDTAAGMRKIVRKNALPRLMLLISTARPSDATKVIGTMTTVKSAIVASDVRNAASPSRNTKKTKPNQNPKKNKPQTTKKHNRKLHA